MATQILKIVEHDAITGEEIIRDMTDAEKAQVIKDKAEADAQAEAQTAKDAARQAVLNKLGLTADEAAALLG